MADINQMLRAKAKKFNVRLEIVEKDYALSYLLAAIADTPGLGDRIALKGGTALKKLYFAEYRFSEDLDYSTLALGPLSDVAAKMDTVTQKMRNRLFERGPFEVQNEALTLKLPHPGEQAGYLVRVQFPGQRQALCRLKVEITVDEPILLPVEQMPVLHGFDELLQVEIRSYALAEIVAEKLRALLQSQARLNERGWGASRVCRDYYDLWSVLRSRERFDGQMPALVAEKCQVRGVSFERPHDFVADELLKVARQEWQQQLMPFVPTAPPVEQILSEVQSFILSLWE
jgi:predicted nucleotidyltransferase component of viral defense system